MYKRILVPVDGSAASTLGRKHAIGLAQTQRARLRFLNVVDESFGWSGTDVAVVDMSELLRSVRALGEKSVKEAASLARKKSLSADISLLQSGGRHASDVILDEAKKWRADLIVMGTHGRRGLNRLLLGSDAERVLRDTPVPLLLVRDERAKTHPKRRVRNRR